MPDDAFTLRLNPLCPCQDPSCLLTEAHFSIVSRMLSNLPSQIRQEIEFIRPIVEERFAKMEEYGEDWHDYPSVLSLSLHG